MRRRRRSGANPLELLVYLAVAPLLRALARLPLSVLHRISDAAFVAVYRVLRVRRAVTRENLRRCFPDAAPVELAAIEERCYRNYCDVAFEWLKLVAMDPGEIRQRVRVDLDAIRPLRDRRRSAIYVLGHCGNWEWAIPAAAFAFPEVTHHVVYHPLRHAGFDRLIRSVRGRFGAVLTPMDDAPRAIVRLRREFTATILVADQRPRTRDPQMLRFLGQDTPFLRGPERLARLLDLPVVYVEMTRVARGRYEMTLEILCDDPRALGDGEITARFARRLEQQIRKTPEDWLWLHRRWRDRRAERGARAPGAPPARPN